MFCNSKAKGGHGKSTNTPYGASDTAGLLKSRVRGHRTLKMEKDMIGNLIEKFGIFSIQKNGIQVCFEEQFKDMIGVLGNFFVGERIFQVVMKLSR